MENLIHNGNMENNKTTTIFAGNSHAQKNVLLQTSKAFVSPVNSMSKEQKRVLFDDCSQKSMAHIQCQNLLDKVNF